MSFNEFGVSAEALLNSTTPLPLDTMLNTQGDIAELIRNQMPSHKMSIDLTRSMDHTPK